MNYEEFKLLVALMREAQKTYFKNRDQASLKTAKALEKQVDQVLAEQPAPATDGAVQLTFTTTQE